MEILQSFIFHRPGELWINGEKSLGEWIVSYSKSKNNLDKPLCEDSSMFLSLTSLFFLLPGKIINNITWGCGGGYSRILQIKCLISELK